MEVIKKCPSSSSTLIIGGDINAQVGNCDDWDDKGITGKVGIPGRNEKGVSLASLLYNFILKAVSTYFQNHLYTTHCTKKGNLAPPLGGPMPTSFS